MREDAKRGRRLSEADLKRRLAASLSKKREFLKWIVGVRVSESTIQRLLKRLGWERKRTVDADIHAMNALYGSDSKRLTDARLRVAPALHHTSRRTGTREGSRAAEGAGGNRAPDEASGRPISRRGRATPRPPLVVCKLGNLTRLPSRVSLLLHPHSRTVGAAWVRCGFFAAPPHGRLRAGKQESRQRTKGDNEMISELLGKEEVNAALVLALSGAVTVLVAKGDGALSLGRVVAGALSNPVPRVVASTCRFSVPAPPQQIAA